LIYIFFLVFLIYRAFKVNFECFQTYSSGPPGLAAGGALGGCLAAYLAQGKLKSIQEVVAELPVEKRNALVSSVGNVLKDADAADAMELVALVQGNVLLKAKVAQEIVTWLGRNTNMRVQQRAAAAEAAASSLRT